jgi:hypothetical protein
LPRENRLQPSQYVGSSFCSSEPHDGHAGKNIAPSDAPECHGFEQRCALVSVALFMWAPFDMGLH